MVLPVITDLIPLTSAGNYMSGFDLKAGFHNCVLADDSKFWFVFSGKHIVAK